MDNTLTDQHCMYDAVSCPVLMVWHSNGTTP